MRLFPSSLTTAGNGLSPPWWRRRVSTLITLGSVALLLSCSDDTLVEPPIQPTETAAAKKGDKPTLDPGTLSIDDMLADPLFQALVLGIEEATMSEPLLAAVDALAQGRWSKAQNLISKVSAEADALEDDPAAAEALIFWSAIQRYLEEAELI